MTSRLRILLLAVGLVALVASVGLARPDGAAPAARTWPPFVLVTGLLMIVAIADEDGTFEAASGLLDRLSGGDLTLYLVAIALVPLVTVILILALPGPPVLALGCALWRSGWCRGAST